jgi:activator of HSP90 ATPase
VAIRQTLEFESTAEQLYNVLTDGKQFAQFTGSGADIGTDDGAAFSCFDGQITGRNIELVPNERIVQAWRAGPWPQSVYSIVRFDIRQSGNTTTLVLEHTGYPEGSEEHLEAGWHKMYWEPLEAYLAGAA